MRRSRPWLPCCGRMETAALPIETPFALPGATPSWPASGGGFANGVIDLGGLEVRQVTTFAKVWSTTRGGQDGLGATFFKPSPVPAGFSVLGHYAQPNNRPLFGRVLVARDDGTASGTGGAAVLAPPLDYTLVWSSSSSDGAGFFWLPTAPEGYKAAGVVVTSSSEKPSVDEVRCVRADFTDVCETEESVWSWSSSGDKDGFSATTLRPAVRGVDARGVHAGTFLATSSTTPVNASTLACLKNAGASLTSYMPDLGQVNAVLAAYAPQVYIHPDESYLPSSVAWFFENGAVLYQKDGGSTPVAADGSNGGNDGAYWLDLPPPGDGGGSRRERVQRGDLASARAYVQAKPMLGGTATDLVLWLFYPFNGPARAKVGPVNVKLGRIGEHVGDWEHVTLRVSNFSGELVRAYFSQHSAGEWVDASRLEYLKSRPVAYASLHGHAMYPRAGTVLQGDAKLGVGIRNDCARGSVLTWAARLGGATWSRRSTSGPGWWWSRRGSGSSAGGGPGRSTTSGVRSTVSRASCRARRASGWRSSSTRSSSGKGPWGPRCTATGGATRRRPPDHTV